ncbi:magnesium transporter [Bowdeniella nasicola]|uniref:Magnesium transporter MgtE n=1 Tax=Bowdeniella nasicola TaxID=208480 RepID=A0A1Q5Q1R9_9ACTO|nr:magnesium transporter [Bowdeniella nasicola]OKL53669.1 magnesium transporter [Bowdeniella nasicola]
MTREFINTALRDAVAEQNTQSPDAFRSAMRELHAADIAKHLVTLTRHDAAKALLALSDRSQAEIFGHLRPHIQVELARIFNREQLATLITAMSHDERVDLFKQLTAEEQSALLPALAHAEREDIRRLGAYPEGTAGSIMTSDYATLTSELLASDALEKLRQEAPDKETIYDIYVIDEDHKLIGVLSLRELLVAQAGTRVGDMMRRNPVFARSGASTDTIAEIIAEYDLLALPVVDESGMLVGIVTVDDAMDVTSQSRGRSVAQFGGNASIDGGPDLSLRSSSFWNLFKTRVFWLAILTVFGIVTSSIVAGQEALLEEIVILAAFIAPIVDAGGNTGSQSATLVIRAMALGEVRLRWRDLWFVIKREIPVVLCLGIVIGILEIILAYFSKGIGIEVLLTVGISMAVCMIIGGLVGALLPFMARRIGTDPATLSSPMITSIMDLLGVMIYFGLAWLFMGHLMV